MNSSANKSLIFILICLGCITVSFNLAATTAVIPVMSVDFGRTDFEVSQVISYYLIPYGLGALLYAPLARFVSYRAIMFVTMTLFSLFSFYCGTTTDLAHFSMARLVTGLVAASSTPMSLMIIGEMFNRKVRGRLVGMYFAASFVGSLAGVVTGGVYHWRWLFFVPAVLGAITALCFLVFGSELSRKHKGHINYLRVLKVSNLRLIFLFIFAISFFFHAVHKWYGVYLSREYGFNQLTISFYFMLTLIGGLIGQLFGGVLTDKIGRKQSCYIGVAGLSLSVLLLAGHYNEFFLGVVMTAVSVFWTIGHNGISTVLTDLPDHDRPMIASLNSSARFLAGGIGFAMSGPFVAKSFPLTFLGIGVLIMLLIFILKIIRTTIN